MLKENQLIEVKMAPSTVNWYKNLGYKYTKESFNVSPQHLPCHSQKKKLLLFVIFVEKRKRFNIDIIYKI